MVHVTLVSIGSQATWEYTHLLNMPALRLSHRPVLGDNRLAAGYLPVVVLRLTTLASYLQEGLLMGVPNVACRF